MDKVQLLAYKNRLLNAGIPYALVLRNLRELQDHYHDLEQLALTQGLSEAEARNAAALHLGDCKKLAAAVIEHSELRSKLHRFPVSTTVLLPLFVHFFICVIFLIGIFFPAVFLSVINNQSLNASELMNSDPQWFTVCMDVIKILLMYIITPILGCIFAFMGIRSHLPKRFWLTGVVLLCLFGSSLHVLDVHLVWPDPITENTGTIGVHYGVVYGQGPGQWAFTYMLRFTTSLLLCGGFAWQYVRKEQSTAIFGNAQ